MSARKVFFVILIRRHLENPLGHPRIGVVAMGNQPLISGMGNGIGDLVQTTKVTLGLCNNLEGGNGQEVGGRFKKEGTCVHLWFGSVQSLSCV